MAAGIHENIPEISDRALHLMRNRETDPVDFLCFPVVLTMPHPTCTPRVEHFLDCPHRACTASVFLPRSECFVAVLRDSCLSAKPSIFGSDPRLVRALLHKHFRSVK